MRRKRLGSKDYGTSPYLIPKTPSTPKTPSAVLGAQMQGLRLPSPEPVPSPLTLPRAASDADDLPPRSNVTVLFCKSSVPVPSSLILDASGIGAPLTIGPAGAVRGEEEWTEPQGQLRRLSRPRPKERGKLKSKKASRSAAKSKGRGREELEMEQECRVAPAARVGMPRVQSWNGLHNSVPKEAQADSWDCGLACARMVLLALSCEDSECSLGRLREELVSDEVWSIDLAYLLTGFGVRCEYRTVCLDGPLSPSRYASAPFYASSLSDDAARVNALLADAADSGVAVRRCSLSAVELWNTLRDEQLVIALVDARELYSAAAADEADEGGGRRDSRGFAGHYVVLAGIDDCTESYVVKDPGREEEELLVPATRLERARRASGTDEDLILLPFDQDPPHAPQWPGVPRARSGRAWPRFED